MTLSDRHRDILVMVAWYIEEYGYAPSMRDIIAFCGLSSPSAAARALLRLEEKGLLRRDRHVSRPIVLTDAGKALLAEARA